MMRELPNYAVEFDHLDFTKVKLVHHQGVVIAIAEAEKKLYYNILNLREQGVDKTEAEGDSKESRKENESTQPDQSWIDSRYWGDHFQPLTYPAEIRLAGASLITFKSDDPAVKAAKWKVLSHSDYLYLFRSVDSTIYGNRFVLNSEPEDGKQGATLNLSLKREARFRRSRKKDIPLNKHDTIDAFDMDGKPFIEPTMSFHNHFSTANDYFDVCIAPSNIPGRHRWQFLYGHNPIYSASVLSAEDGWLDFSDIVLRPFWPFNCPPGKPRQYLKLLDSPAIMIYQPQEKIAEEKEKSNEMIPAAPRLMVAAPTENQETSKKQMLVFDIPLATNGDGVPLITNQPGGIALQLQDVDYGQQRTVSTGSAFWPQCNSNMGVLTWIETSKTPNLTQGSDGKIHLYWVDDNDKKLKVTTYDSTKAEHVYWTLNTNHQDAQLKLVAREISYTAANTIVSLNGSTLTIQSPTRTETWANLP
ncbi:MAG: hypothetical protein AAGD96_19995, partial [Chloroflexota bacterium]